MSRATIRIGEDGKIIEISDKENIVRTSIITQELVKCLLNVQVGTIIDYARLHGIAEMDVRPNEPGYGYLYRARQILERQGIFFAAVKNVGIERISDEAVANNGPSRIRLIGKHARREARRLGAIRNFDKLSSEAKINHNMSVTFLSTFAALTRPKTMKQVTEKVKLLNNTLPTVEMLEALKK